MALSTSHDEVRLQGGGLLLEFVHARDRFEHRLIAADGVQPVVILNSLEGTPQQAWPASPPLQQIHRDTTPTGEPLVLGVGMAGRSHWSLSARLDVQQEIVEFDAACRASERPRRLVSLYRLGDSIRAERNGAGVRLLRDEVIWQIEPFGGAGTANARIELDEEHVAVYPAREVASYPATLCWRYVVRRVT